jgi:CubicO group peptidase (beta-lactamase class C family)
MMFSLRFRCAFLLYILFAARLGVSVVQAQTVPPIDLNAIDAYLQEELTIHRLPGLAVAIVEGDRVLLVRGYGNAGGGKPVTPQTQFYIGSCTKSFTALAVMQLVEQGKLDLDAPIQRYLPWFKVTDDAASAQITVRHLLNHTSGLSEAGDSQSHIDFPSLTDQARALQHVRLTAPVGTKFQYYNPNYRVLGLLIEQVSGQSYEEYLRDHVLKPLAMSQTVTRPTEASTLAQGYGQAFGLPIPRSQDFHPGSLPSGYLISTAEDLAHYLIALLNNGRYGNEQVVQPATLAQMLTPPIGINSEQIAPPPAVTQMFPSATGLEADYGMGWVVGHSADGVNLIFHAGDLENFHADMLLLPKQKRGFVILVNQGSLFRQFLDQNPLWIGLASLMIGHSLSPQSSMEWVFPVFALIVAADLGINLLRLWRLPRWGRKVAKRSRVVRWLCVLIDVVIPLAVLGFPLLLGPALGGKSGWSSLFDLLPDVAMWLILSATLSLIRGAAKVMILTRPTSRQTV